MRLPPPARPRAGFSLVETALAVGVVGIGLVGLVGLYPAGLEMSRRAVHDSYGGLFAEAVLNGLRAQVRAHPDLHALESLTIPLDLPWAEVTPDRVVPTTTPVKVILRSRLDPEAEDVAIWYRLDFTDVHWLDQGAREVQVKEIVTWPQNQAGQSHTVQPVDGPWFTATNVVSEVTYPDLRRARLLVWVGHRVNRNHMNDRFRTGPRPHDDTPDLRRLAGAPRDNVYYNNFVEFHYAELYGYR